MADDLTIKFGADIKEVTAALAQIRAALQDASTLLRQTVDGTTSNNKRAAQDSGKEWQGVISTVSSSFGTFLWSTLLGTQSWEQALAKLFENLAGAFINQIGKMIVEWATFEAGLSSSNPFSGGIFGGLFGGGGLLSGLFGGGGSVAGAADIGDEMMMLGAFATGAWNLPRDGFAYVHQGEMVVPADIAAMYRDKGAGGGGVGAPFPAGGAAGAGAAAGPQIVFAPQISAVDAGSVRTLLMSQGQTMAQLFLQQVRGSNQNLRAALASAGS